MRESEIRADHLRKEQAKRLQNDVIRLLQYKDNFIHVPCPACGSDRASKAFIKYNMDYFICSDCETMYINPRPTPQILEMYYAASENNAYWNKYIFPASERTRREKIIRPRAEKIINICNRNNIAKGVLLEVGAGYGTFCEEIINMGHFRKVIAVEPTPDLAETCRSKKLEVIELPIENVHLEHETIDVIVSFEVIEHLYSPIDFINTCSSILAPGGLLVLTCPNVKGFDIATLQHVSDTVDNEHLNYFHPASLSLLLERCNLEILEILTPGLLDAELVRKKVLDGSFTLKKQLFLRQILIDEWESLGGKFQHFLSENNMSSHLWVVSQRV